MRLGPPEIILILIVVLLVFGVGKLPQIGKSLGEGLKSFKQGVSGDEEIKKTEMTSEQPKVEAVTTDAPAKVSEEDLAAFKKWQAAQTVKKI